MKEERAKEILEELGWQGINKSNPADICRECELKQKVQQLEQVGDRIVKLVNEVYAMAGGPCMLQDAVKEWEKTKEE